MLNNSEMVGFAEGTPVLMASGEWKAIEKIKVGEMVMSFDPKGQSDDLVPRKVVNTLNDTFRDCIEVHAAGTVTVAAKNQLFFIPGAGWLPAYETKTVVGYDGAATPIQVRNVKGGKWKIYDITVDENHSLVANGLRVHNGGGKKRRSPPPQPIVTAGKPGRPVSVTISDSGGQRTITVNPPPGSSGQINVTGNNVTVGSSFAYGVPIRDLTITYEPPRILPYPTIMAYSDRVSNAQTLRNSVCGNILAKGPNYKVRTSDKRAWDAQLDNLISELNGIIREGPIRFPHRGVHYNAAGFEIEIWRDPTGVNDAVNMVRALKGELRSGKRINYSFMQNTCAAIEGVISRIERQVTRPIPMPPPPVTPPVVVVPTPEINYSERIYQDDANYPYMVEQANTCRFAYDPPNAPAITQTLYYKHFDNTRNQFYFDRNSANPVCE